jgi:hypothetical protein
MLFTLISAAFIKEAFEGHFVLVVLGVFGAAFYLWLALRVAPVREKLLSPWRKFANCTEPPRFAAFLMFVAFPRQHRETTIGDLDEDFKTNVLPRFGQLGATIWYTYKAVLYIALFRRAEMRKKPAWKRLLVPGLKYFLAPLLVAHKFGWIDKLETFLRSYKLL